MPTDPTPSDTRPSAELALRVLDQLTVAVGIIGRNGLVEYANPAAAELFGALREIPAGQSVGSVDWGATDEAGAPLPASELPVEITRTTCRPCESVQLSIPGRSGAARWLRVTTRPIAADEAAPCRVLVSFLDVTDRVEELEELRRANERFSGSFEHAPIGMAIVDPHGRFLQVNRALCDVLGHAAGELRSRTFAEFTHPDDLDADLILFQEVLDGARDGYQMTKRYLHADGHVIHAELTVSVVRDAAGTPVHFVSQIQDVTERQLLEQRLTRLADHDSMTGLLNRRRFQEELASQHERCRRLGERAAVAVIDVDRFKSTNDSHGHAAGDRLLTSVAAALSVRCRSNDVLARLGGDEFGVILRGVEPGAAQNAADALVGAAREHQLQDELPASVSVGLTMITTELGVHQLLERADRALYAAKAAGRDRGVVAAD